MDKLIFDPTINTGNILAMLMVMGGLIAFWIKIETSLAQYETKMNNMEKSLQEVKEELTWLRRYHFNLPRQSFQQIPNFYEYAKEYPPRFCHATDYPYGPAEASQRMDTEGIRPKREKGIVVRIEQAPKYI